MAKFTKNAVKLLNNIYNSENKVVVYTEFDGFFEVGDKLYIMVNTNGISFSQEYYKLDSYYNSGTTNSKIGYTLLEKIDNYLKLDIDYDTLGITNLNSVDCYIGRVYIKDSEISRGTINGTLLHNIKFNVSDTLNLSWKQGIIFKVSGSTISNINFKDKYDSSFLILKSEINIYNGVESYYTYNNYNIGLSVINLNGIDVTLYGSNIYSGSFYSCTILGSPIYIYGGYLEECSIGDSNSNITVDGGYLYNCTVTDNILASMKWVNGKWYHDWTGTTGNPFNFTDWKDGVWEKGIFPDKVWHNGRFISGNFNGTIWYDGIFSNGTFKDSIWDNGYFNGGLISGSTWYDGCFNNGSIIGTQWVSGIMNGGEMSNCTWTDGVVNYGVISNTYWSGGTFNDGRLSGCTWLNGIFKNGLFDDGSLWKNGTFHGGTFNKSTWNNGKFYNGSIFSSEWIDGEMYFGTVTKLNWYGGTWYNGIANSIDFYDGTWYDGIFNSGRFYDGTWYNGSFNNGYFGTADSLIKPKWYGGIFYYGDFYGQWSGGTFYTGNYTPGTIPAKDYIGKEFVPYNRNGLLKKPKPITREPKLTPNIVSTTVKDAKVTPPPLVKQDTVTVTQTVVSNDGTVSTVTKESKQNLIKGRRPTITKNS